ncbi:ATP-binding protein [Peredibacter sp. HCB2-198]|uniref:ATP-binding protein n=1 Tax=Peredibacter sp. HCB2-198 TaxID=3383025 RepID=UPI0038B620AF
MNLWTDFFWTLSSIVCAIRCFRTSNRMEIRSLKLSWRWLGIGSLSWTVGMFIWGWRQLVENVVVPFPDISTFFFLGIVPCIVIAMIHYCWNVSRRENKLITIADIGISLCVISFVCIILFYRPIIEYHGSKFYLIMVLAYPCLYITALFFATLQIWESRPINKLPYTLLLIGLASLAGVNIAYAYGLLHRFYQPGHMLDIFWTVGFYFFYWAACEEEQQILKRPPSTAALRPNLARALFPGMTLFFVIASAYSYQAGFQEIESILLMIAAVFTMLIGLRAWVTQNSQFRLQAVSEHNAKKLDAVIQQMPAGLVITDTDSQEIVFYNNQATEILHGKLDFISELRKDKEEVDLVINPNETITVLRQSSDVETKFKERFNILTFVDITEKKQIYEEAKRVAQMREDFLLLVSHELKTPITTLKLGMQFVQKKTTDENMKKVIQPCLEEIRRFENLTNDLIDISNIDAGRLSLDPERINLKEVVLNVFARFDFELTTKKYEVVYKTMEDVYGLWDQMRIEQVIINLLNNAIKYGDQRPIEVSVYKDGSQAVLVIRDHGPGVAVEERERIFHKFERASSTKHFGGFGIGLFVSKTIVNAHKGAITVDEAKGGGAEFTVRLPIES